MYMSDNCIYGKRDWEREERDKRERTESGERLIYTFNVIKMVHIYLYRYKGAHIYPSFNGSEKVSFKFSF